MWNFKPFIPDDSKRHYGTPALTIHKNLAMTLSSGAIKQFSLEDADSVVLYWDADKRAIGLEFTNGPSSFRVSQVKSAARISARAFVRHIGVTKTIRVPLKRDTGSGFLVAELPT